MNFDIVRFILAAPLAGFAVLNAFMFIFANDNEELWQASCKFYKIYSFVLVAFYAIATALIMASR